MRTKKVPYRKTPQYRQRLEIGRSLAALLPQYKTQAQVAKELGISRFTVDEVESLALEKLFRLAHKNPVLQEWAAACYPKA